MSNPNDTSNEGLTAEEVRQVQSHVDGCACGLCARYKRRLHEVRNDQAKRPLYG